MGTAKTTKSASRIYQQKHFKVSGPWMDTLIYTKSLLYLFPHLQVMIKNFKKRFRTSDDVKDYMHSTREKKKTTNDCFIQNACLFSQTDRRAMRGSLQERKKYDNTS